MSKCKITGKVLAIQLGREETQIVLMGTGSEILHGITVSTPAGAVEDGMIRNQDAVREMLKTALKEPEFKRVRQAVFSLCTSQVITEIVTTPDLPTARLEKLLQANVDMYFPVDMQEYQLVWQAIGPKNNDNSLKELAVQLWALPTAMVSRYYSVANACGLSVVGIDYCGHSIATAVGASFSRPGKAGKERKKLDLNREISFGRKKKEAEPVAPSAVATETRNIPDTDLHLTLERDLLGMTFVQNGQVVFQRFIRCGSDPTYQFGELAMMVEYYRSLDMGRGSRLTGVISGSLAWDKQLIRELADVLGISLTTFTGDYEPQWCLCVGAARTTLDFGVPSLNSPGKARKQIQSQLWQYALVLAGGLALMAVILLTLSSRLIWNSGINSLENTRQTLTIQAQKTAGYADNYNNYSTLYDNYSADWDTIFASLRAYNDNLVLVLEELENTLPENTSVTNMQIAPDGLTVEFACATKEEAAYLIMALRELQYADLAAISNLRGGGGGPATSYGSDETEEPPTEGSADLTSVRQTNLTALIASDLGQEELIEVALDLNSTQFGLLENTYGQQPQTGYSSLSALEGASTITDTHRSNAITQMLTTNPFAMKRFKELVDEERNNIDKAVLLWALMDGDLEYLQEQGVELGGDLWAKKDVLVGVLVKADNLPATEELICTDAFLERSYVHYLEAQLGLRGAEKFPYLKMDKIADDLLQKESFDTGDDQLNSMLNGLVSETVWGTLEDMKSEEEPGGDDNTGDDNTGDDNTGDDNTGDDNTGDDNTGDDNTGDDNTGVDNTGDDNTGDDNTGDDNTGDDNTGGYSQDMIATWINNYIATGESGDPRADIIIENYLTTGKSGAGTSVDNMIKSYINSGAMDDEISAMLKKYLTTGTTGNPILNDMIEEYLTTGSTGNDELDDLFDGYIYGGYAHDEISDLLLKYLMEETTGNEVFDDLIESYVKTGDTGNKKLNDMFKEYVSSEFGSDSEGSEFTEELIADWLNKYFNDGSTGNTLADDTIEKFLKTGSTGNQDMDKIIEDYINSGKLDDEMSALVDKYIANGGKTNNPTIDSMIKKYFEEETTGNEMLDKLIKKYLSVNDFTSSDDLDDLINSLLGGGSGSLGSSGGSGGGSAGNSDTRIHFTAALGYNDELKNAELTRKGLSYSDKIDKLEVED